MQPVGTKLTVHEAAVRLGISDQAVRQAIWRKKLTPKPTKLGRDWRLDAAAIDRYADEHQQDQRGPRKASRDET